MPAVSGCRIALVPQWNSHWGKRSRKHLCVRRHACHSYPVDPRDHMNDKEELCASQLNYVHDLKEAAEVLKVPQTDPVALRDLALVLAFSEQELSDRGWPTRILLQLSEDIPAVVDTASRLKAAMHDLCLMAVIKQLPDVLLTDIQQTIQAVHQIAKIRRMSFTEAQAFVSEHPIFLGNELRRMNVARTNESPSQSVCTLSGAAH